MLLNLKLLLSYSSHRSIFSLVLSFTSFNGPPWEGSGAFRELDVIIEISSVVMFNKFMYVAYPPKEMVTSLISFLDKSIRLRKLTSDQNSLIVQTGWIMSFLMFIFLNYVLIKLQSGYNHYGYDYWYPWSEIQ